MYKSFHIQNYRCFEDLEINDLKQINLIAGKNNTGKTSLLEAIFMYSNPNNPELTFNVNAFRGIQKIKLEFGARTPWDSLFRSFDTAESILFSSNADQRTLEIRIVRDVEELAKMRPVLQRSGDITASTPEAFQVVRLDNKSEDKTLTHYMIVDQHANKWVVPIPPRMEVETIFLTAKERMPQENRDQIDADRFSNLKLLRKMDLLLESLRIIEPRLNDLHYLKDGIYADAEIEKIDQLVPLSIMGDGITSLMRIILAMGYARDGILLIDEIENGLHYSVQKDVWRAIAKAARDFKVQVFATTHSLEMIKAAHEAFKDDDDGYDFRLHRLDRSKKTGKISSVTYDQETLGGAIKLNFEVR
jgi:predicted ATPase